VGEKLMNFIQVAHAAAGTVASHVAIKMDAWDLIWGAGAIVKFVLFILFSFSVISWAIIFMKNIQLGRLRWVNSRFLDVFWKATSLDSIYGEIKNYQNSSLAQVFKAGYIELQRIAETQMGNKEKKDSGVSLSGVDNIHRALRKASDNEISILESKVGFLATAGSTAPFIGLFGTVWGIMNSFQNIGSQGAASLAVVAPGISEALIATAIGLAAAIPSVMAYNYFIGKIRREELEISNFETDFLNIVKRNFFKD